MNLVKFGKDTAAVFPDGQPVKQALRALAILIPPREKHEAGSRVIMAIIRTEFQFANPTDRTLQPVKALALVDTGALHLCLPEHIVIQLDLKQLERREVTLAKGHRITVPYCGSVEIQFKNRRCFTGAMIMGDEPLLGAIPMEDMDLVVIPGRHCVDVNPASPNIPSSLAKSADRSTDNR